MDEQADDPNLAAIYRRKYTEIAGWCAATSDAGQAAAIVSETEITLDRLEEVLDGPYLAGPAYSLADVAWTPIFDRLIECDLEGLWIDGRRPRLTDYMVRLMSRPSLIRPLPPISMDDGSDMTANTSPGEELEPDVLEMLLSSVRKFSTSASFRAKPRSTRPTKSRLASSRRCATSACSTTPFRLWRPGFRLTAEVQVAFALGRAASAFRSTIGTNNDIGSLALVRPVRRTASALPAAHGGRRVDRLVRIDRARRRLGRQIAAHRRRARRPPLRPQWPETFHHQRAGRRCLHGNGADRRLRRRRNFHVPGRSRHARPASEQAGRQDGPARLEDLRRLFRRLPGAGVGADRRRRRRLQDRHESTRPRPACTSQRSASAPPSA